MLTRFRIASSISVIATRVLAAEFRDEARVELAQITASGRVRCCGGTVCTFERLSMACLRAASGCASRGKPWCETLRDWQAGMHERLALLDPDTATRLNANDRQRVQRALEVIA